jgi:hypothetical protein
MTINRIDKIIDNQIDNIIQLNIEKIKNMISNNFEPYKLFQNLSGNNIGDLFGASIDYAKDNNLLTIGVPYHDDGNTNAGAIFIYTGNADNGWSFNNKILSSGIIDYMGTRVSTNKDGSVIVTNCQAGVGSNQKNEVHIYTGNPQNGWNLHQILSGVVNYSVGDWLKISNNGNVILVSDLLDNSKGSVFIYTKRDNGQWEFSTKLAGSNNDDFFGYSIDISDNENVIVVGAVGDDAGGDRAGAGFIYSRQPGVSTWSLKQKITGYGVLDRFGESVATNTNGSVVVIGGNLYNSNELNDIGGAIVYTGYTPFGASPPSSWKYKQTLLGDKENGSFGNSVAINSNGNIIILGSTADSPNGSFIVFSGQKSNFPYAFPDGWIFTQKITGLQSSSSFSDNLSMNSEGNVIISTAALPFSSLGNVYIYKS